MPEFFAIIVSLPNEFIGLQCSELVYVELQFEQERTNFKGLDFKIERVYDEENEEEDARSFGTTFTFYSFSMSWTHRRSSVPVGMLSFFDRVVDGSRDSDVSFKIYP